MFREVIARKQREWMSDLTVEFDKAWEERLQEWMLNGQRSELDLRNLLTTFSPYDEFVTSLARHLDAETLQIQKLLSSLTLKPTNRDVHTASAETVWAPIVRSSKGNCILPPATGRRTRVELFVIARYNAFFSGFADQDESRLESFVEVEDGKCRRFGLPTREDYRHRERGDRFVLSCGILCPTHRKRGNHTQPTSRTCRECLAASRAEVERWLAPILNYDPASVAAAAAE